MSTQKSFFTLERDAFGKTRTEEFLEKISKAVPRETIVQQIKHNRMRKEKGIGGRPRLETEIMIKCMFLQGLYDLSRDRRSASR